ncbi:MAG: acylphosphatase [Candidatus Omnitrophica bacterium]|nr:acylphosphatase [Candidatus Omnitrophota bacterium]
MIKQFHVLYSGNVQGVGFRFTCISIARELGIVGWVRNLSAGEVELTAEAEEVALMDMSARIKQEFSRYIDSVDIKWLEPKGEFKDFIVKF